MTDQPRYYQPLEVPAFCFIWEAVLWVTFGRFPEGDGYDSMDELNEELGMLSFAWKDSFGGPRYRFKGFWWFESEMAGVNLESVDWERYERALRMGYQRLDVLQAYLKHGEPEEPEKVAGVEERITLQVLLDRAEIYRDFCKTQLEDFSFVESVHQQHQQSIDRGWSLIFQALADGKLQGYGWGDMTQDEIRVQLAKGDVANYEPSAESEGKDGNVINPWHVALPPADIIGPLQQMGMHVAIPKKEWSLGGVAPDGRYVTAAGRNWWDVCFPTEQLFALFPRPLFASNVVEAGSIEIVNPGLAIGSVDSKALPKARISASAPSGRGRKKLADGEIERACQALYSTRWTSGENKDSLHAEAAAFAQQVWGETLPRTTFQGYMTAASRAPKIPPENAPGIAAE
jgi:hypothetical protein